jgi:hypothetical protein
MNPGPAKGPTSRSLQIFFFVLCGLGSNCGRFRTKLSAASASLRICASTRTGVSCRGDPGQQGLGPLPGLGVGPGMGPWLLKSPPDNNRAPCNTVHTVQTLPSHAEDTVRKYSPVEVGRCCWPHAAYLLAWVASAEGNTNLINYRKLIPGYTASQSGRWYLKQKVKLSP